MNAGLRGTTVPIPPTVDRLRTAVATVASAFASWIALIPEHPALDHDLARSR
jgi:hypothetical protein